MTTIYKEIYAQCFYVVICVVSAIVLYVSPQLPLCVDYLLYHTRFFAVYYKIHVGQIRHVTPVCYSNGFYIVLCLVCYCGIVRLSLFMVLFYMSVLRRSITCLCGVCYVTMSFVPSFCSIIVIYVVTLQVMHRTCTFSTRSVKVLFTLEFDGKIQHY